MRDLAVVSASSPGRPSLLVASDTSGGARPIRAADRCRRAGGGSGAIPCALSMTVMPAENLKPPSSPSRTRTAFPSGLSGQFTLARNRTIRASSNSRFENDDAVLYELVKPKDGGVPQPGQKAGSIIGQVQHLMKDVLNLDFQLDDIDYSKPNFVHADMDAETFTKMQEDRGEMLFQPHDQADHEGIHARR